MMDRQIDKLQMLITLEKGVLCAQYHHQKRQALYMAAIVVFSLLVLLSINVAIFCHLSDFIEFAKNAWLVAGLNAVLAVFPLVLLFNGRQPTPQEKAANDVRTALLHDLKENVESGAKDIKLSIEKVQALSKDIRMFSEGGLTALIPLIKLASGVMETKDKPKAIKQHTNKEGD